jgi:hypothetical protein
MLGKNTGPSLKPATISRAWPVQDLSMESIVMASRNTDSPVQSDKTKGGHKDHDCEHQPPAVGITELYVRQLGQITQTAVVRYSEMSTKLGYTEPRGRSCAPTKLLPPCERSTKVKLLPCEGMTRPLKDHQAFGACQSKNGIIPCVCLR